VSAYRSRTPRARGERWSLDFMADTLADGQAFRTLNIVDDFTRASAWLPKSTARCPVRVVRVLERLQALMGLPRTIVGRQRSSVCGARARHVSLYERRRAALHSAGKPIENAYIESFKRKLSV
jgi:putative transposase